MCACQRGSRAGVSAPREAEVSDVRGRWKRAAPSRATGCQDAHHALFRYLSLVSVDLGMTVFDGFCMIPKFNLGAF